MESTDPLVALPPEIVFRILDFARVSSIAALSRTSKSWHGFIDRHQDAIYASLTDHGRARREPADYRHDVTSFSKYYDGADSWKELCKRQTLLRANWDLKTPVTTESVIQVGRDPVWRFRPDFKRRFIMSTSQSGGVKVTCMDTGDRLWTLSPDDVRLYAHLEYNEVGGRGVAVWDRWGNAVEVWRTTEEDGGPRGIFERVAVLHHDCETRGYQLSYDTLCVVSTQGQAFVYDMAQTPPQQTTRLEIEEDAVGHLDQDQDYVMFSLGSKGYHVHDKSTGRFLGAIEPWRCSVHNFYHIEHPVREENGARGTQAMSIAELARHSTNGPVTSIFPPRSPNEERLLPLAVQKKDMMGTGEFEDEGHAESLIRDDDWGAGMLWGSLMVGVSRGGRIIVVSNWRDCLAHAEGSDSEKAQKAFAKNARIIMCAPHDDPRNFDLGGWLSIHDNRILFEIRDCIYIVALNADGSIPADPDEAERPSYATNKSSTYELASPVPVSFMALYDDCLMHTYTTLGLRDEGDEDDFHPFPPPGNRLFLTKTIRVLSLAPVDDQDASVMGTWEAMDEDTRTRTLMSFVRRMVQ